MRVSSSNSSPVRVEGKKQRSSVDIIHYYSEHRAPRRENQSELFRREGGKTKEKKKVWAAAFTAMNERQKAPSAHTARACVW